MASGSGFLGQLGSLPRGFLANRFGMGLPFDIGDTLCSPGCLLSS